MWFFLLPGCYSLICWWPLCMLMIEANDNEASCYTKKDSQKTKFSARKCIWRHMFQDGVWKSPTANKVVQLQDFTSYWNRYHRRLFDNKIIQVSTFLASHFLIPASILIRRSTDHRFFKSETNRTGPLTSFYTTYLIQNVSQIQNGSKQQWLALSNTSSQFPVLFCTVLYCQPWESQASDTGTLRWLQSFF
jgi:hypothetical protein